MRANIAVWLLLPTFLSGCWYVTPEEARDRLDLDQDGVPAPDDCDDDDPQASAFTAAYVDADGDGYGAPGNTLFFCGAPPSGYSSSNADCDDSAWGIHPTAVETCDGVDENCDGGIDEGLGTTWYSDGDGDGFGAEDSGSVVDCARVEGMVTVAGDCDDGDAAVAPDAAERCNNAVDDDCDESTDCRYRGALGKSEAATIFYGQAGLGTVLAAGDATGDGRSDVLLADADGTVRVFDSPPGPFLSVAQSTAAFNVGQVADGLFAWAASPDGSAFATLDEDGFARVYRGPVDALVSADDADLSLGAVDALLLADLDGDGADELVTGVGGTVYVTDGSGSGTVDPTSGWTGAVAADGAAHLAFLGEVEPGERWWLIGATDAAWLMGSALAGDSVVSVDEVALTKFANAQPGGVEAQGAPAGDLDGDGQRDVLLSFAGWTDDEASPGKGLVAAYYGGDFAAVVTTDEADLRVVGTSNVRFGESLAAGCDLDGDGRADFLAGTAMGVDSIVYGFYGTATGGTRVPADADFSVAGTDGIAPACAGDVNDDGRGDVLVAAPAEPVSEVYLFVGRGF